MPPKPKNTPAVEMNTKLESLEKENQRLAMEKQEIYSVNYRYKEEIVALNEKLERSVEVINKLQSEIACENVLEKKMKTLEKELKKTVIDRERVRTATKPNSSQDDQVQRLSAKIRTLEDELISAKVQFETQQKKSSSAKEDTATSIEKENGQLKAKLGEIEEENKKLKADNSAGKTRISELEQTCHAAFEQVEKKDKELKRVKAEHDKLIERKDNTIADLRRKQHMVDPTAGSSNSRRLHALESENEHLKTRLGEIVGTKLTSNNTEIADLSDEYRPQKLGEMYNELFDNEWTDAFEEIEPGKGSEEAAIQYQRQILEEAHMFSKMEAVDYCCHVNDLLLKFYAKSPIRKEDELPLTLNRLLVDFRKRTSPYLKDRVSKRFVEMSTKCGDCEKMFRGRCAELCWLMAMQEPPVVLNTSGGSGDFDTGRYRVYTNRGKSVDYIVWPPLQLHKEGPLLSKGIAQGK